MGCGASNHGGRGTPLRLRPQAPKDAPMAEPAEAIPARAPAAPGLATLLDNWRQILATGNLPAGRRLDAVSRWLLITRACVFSMTLTAGLIGGLLAAGAPAPRWGLFGLALAGLVVAHAANNMINDFFDTTGGVDTAEYTRALYAPHPLLAGLVSRRGLLAAIAAANLLDLAILVVLAAARGWPVVAFALAGLFVSVFYVAPPLRLKHHGLGEPGVFLVWGPLMIGGTYYVTAGALPAWVWLASVPYAIPVTSVLVGKHIDKYEQDRARGLAAAQPGADDRVLPRRGGARGDAEPRARRRAGCARAPAARARAPGLRGAATRRAAARLPHLAALVRGARLCPQPPGRRALRARARGERRARAVDARQCRGRPRMRCAMMLRCTSLVPPAIVMARSPRYCRAQRPRDGARGSSCRAAQGPSTSIAVSENSCESPVDMSLIAAERCGFMRPWSSSVSVRSPAQRMIVAFTASAVTRWRTTGSASRPCSRAVAVSQSRLCSKRMLPAMPLRSFTSALETISHPCPSRPRRFSTGTRTSVMKTSLNSVPPSICRIGRTSMPGLRMSMRSTESPAHLGPSGDVRTSTKYQSAMCA